MPNWLFGFIFAHDGAAKPFEQNDEGAIHVVGDVAVYIIIEIWNHILGISRPK